MNLFSIFTLATGFPFQPEYRERREPYSAPRTLRGRIGESSSRDRGSSEAVGGGGACPPRPRGRSPTS